MTTIAIAILTVFNLGMLLYFFLLNGVYLVLILLAFRALRNYALRLETLDPEDALRRAGAPPITVIAPAFNEAETCVESVHSLLNLNYPDREVIFVNDGSTDDTLNRLRHAFQLQATARLSTADLPTAAVRGVYLSRLHPRLWVIDKDNGGKADALNAGINFTTSPLFCAVDADSILERDALSRIVRPFLEDDHTIAAGGVIRIANGCTVRQGIITDVRLPKNRLAQLQVLEYLRAFLAGRIGLSSVGMTLIISGAFGLFKRETVVGAGGYATARTSGETVGEDMELIVRLQRYCKEHRIPGRITFVPDSVAWTECPESLRVLGRQRDRWQRGLADALIRHRVMLGNPRYGVIGLLAFPYFFFLEMLGPAIEVLGYLAFVWTLVLGLWTPLYVIAFLMVAVVFWVAISVGAVVLEELTFRRYLLLRDLLRLFLIAILENFGYRQISTYWRARGLLSAARGVRSWGEMDRVGFDQSAADQRQKSQDPDKPIAKLR